jgi:hypothetical protein
MNSLEGTNEQIKLRELINECKRTGIEPETVCKVKTGLSVDEYLKRPFNRLMYYKHRHQLNNWKQPEFNFWIL